MNEIVAIIQQVREQRRLLENTEKELVSSLSLTGATPEFIYNEFLKIKSIDKFSEYSQKKMFIFICSSICCPTFAIGDRLPNGIRCRMSKLTGVHPVQISYIVNEVRILYKTYKDFKQEADYLYNSIRRSLTS